MVNLYGDFTLFHFDINVCHRFCVLNWVSIHTVFSKQGHASNYAIYICTQ